MPLNENEERILREIEERFHAHDPDSARRISSTTLPRYLARNARWATLGFVGGLVILLVGFASSWIVGVFGFLLMVVSAVALIRNLHRMGKFGLQQLKSQTSERNLGQAIDEATKRFRRRFGQDDD